jgi:hypothetical protein
MRATLLVALLALAGGCLSHVGGQASDGSPGAGDPDALPPAFDPNRTDPNACQVYDCSNVIDAVIIPMLAGNGLSITRDDDGALCRRMALDLTGLVPSAAEAADRCAGKPAAEMVDYFMNKSTNAIAIDGTPPYVFVNRRHWSRIFSYQASQQFFDTFYFNVRKLDELVGELYAGNIRYDEFARRALASPGFVQRFGNFQDDSRDLVQIAGQAYRIFLGREALPAEATNFGNLFRAWSSFQMGEAETLAAYPDCPAGTVPPANGPSCAHYELGLKGQLCEGVARPGCQSSVLGVAEVVPSSTAFVRIAELSPVDRAAIETPGRLMVARPEFAEAAVDLALRKYLGWWKDGVYQPDFDAPNVRHALAQKLVADGYDIRKLEREILTSVLYTQGTTRSQTVNVPLWAFAPTKLMSAIQLYENTSIALGVQRNAYDFRYHNSINFVDHFGKLGGPSFSVYLEALLGDLGDAGGLNALFARRGLLEDICNPNGIAPDATVDQLIDHAFVGVGRPATGDERKTIADALSAPGRDGCPDLTSCDRGVTAIALCRSLYASALYTYY